MLIRFYALFDVTAAASVTSNLSPFKDIVLMDYFRFANGSIASCNISLKCVQYKYSYRKAITLDFLRIFSGRFNLSLDNQRLVSFSSSFSCFCFLYCFYTSNEISFRNVFVFFRIFNLFFMITYSLFKLFNYLGILDILNIKSWRKSNMQRIFAIRCIIFSSKPT